MTAAANGRATRDAAKSVPRKRTGTGGTAPARTHPAHPTPAQVPDSHAMLITLPGDLGKVRLPAPDRLAFYGGIVALAAFGIVDWPVALVIGVGHLLADDHHHKVLAEFGQALAEA